jgi:hypothetical protein
MAHLWLRMHSLALQGSANKTLGQRPEIGVDGINVELVSYPGRQHDSRIRVTRRVMATLGTDYSRLCPRLSDKQHPILGGEPG